MNFDEINEIDDILQNLEQKKQRKKKINSSKKGKRGESKICKILSKHFGKEFNRVPSSGAINTIHNLDLNAREVLAGDIICPNNFSFVIENKTGYDLDIISVFKEKSSSKSLLNDFIKQATKDAKKAKKNPLIIYSKNYREPVVIIPENLPSVKQEELKNILTKVSYFYFISSNKSWKNWYIFSLSNFLNLTSFDFYFD